jgi:hypothetical protein
MDKTQSLSNDIVSFLKAQYPNDTIFVDAFYEDTTKKPNQAFVLQENVSEDNYWGAENIGKHYIISIFVRNTSRRNAELKCYAYISYLYNNYSSITSAEYCVQDARIISYPYSYSRTDQNLALYNARIQFYAK